MSKDLLSVESLSVVYPREDLAGKKSEGFEAVRSVSFRIQEGGRFGLIGGSGSGKTTLARALAGLLPCTGRIECAGKDILSLSARKRSLLLHLIFQNPDTALNPSMSLSRLLAEPLLIHRRGSSSERKRLCERTLETVGLDPALGRRRLGELSGGQRQRAAIACALLSEAKLIVCDEILAALDLSVQAHILNLLARINEERGTSFLFISHDIEAVCYFCDQVAVMQGGSIVEAGDALSIFNKPEHPYTRRLREAMPSLSAKKESYYTDLHSRGLV